MTSKVTDVKMLLGDGSEVPAEVVLRDKDLDLAFVRPVQKPAAPWPCVSLDAKAQAQILDEIVVLNQLGKVARRTHSVFVDRIEAIVDKPRKFYVPAQHRGQMIMCSPAFTLDGKFLGIGAIKTIKGEGGGMMGMGGDMLIILVPASDIKESSTQVPPFGEKPKEIGSEPAAPAEKEKPKEGAAPAQGAPAEKPKEGAAPAPKG